MKLSTNNVSIGTRFNFSVQWKTIWEVKEIHNRGVVVETAPNQYGGQRAHRHFVDWGTEVEES